MQKFVTSSSILLDFSNFFRRRYSETMVSSRLQLCKGELLMVGTGIRYVTC